MRARTLPFALVLLAGGSARAEAPDTNALGLGPIDVATLDLGIGTASALDADRTDVEGRLGLTLLRAELPGISLELVELSALARAGTDRFSGTIVSYSIDHWLIATSKENGERCLVLPGFGACDPDPESGFWGFSIALPSFQYDGAPGRWGARFAESALVLSPTPGYGAGYRHRHVLVRAGISIDHLWDRRGEESETFLRPFAGIDAALRLGSIDLAPSFRWRVAVQRFPDDFGVEALLRISHRGTWHGRGQAGDPSTLAVTVGYAHWSEPAHSFGADWSALAAHTLFVRFSMAPSFYSVFPTL